MNDNAETLGDALGPGVTKDTLAETERVLQRFQTVNVEEFDRTEEWIETAHRAVVRALDHYDEELGETTDGRSLYLNWYHCSQCYTELCANVAPKCPVCDCGMTAAAKAGEHTVAKNHTRIND